MSGVKRCDAVHLRYEESNIRYGEGCEVEVVAAYDHDRVVQERDTLRAQVEAMRVALEQAARGIIWIQASVPMSIRISKQASKYYNAAKRAALQAKP